MQSVERVVERFHSLVTLHPISREDRSCNHLIFTRVHYWFGNIPPNRKNVTTLFKYSKLAEHKYCLFVAQIFLTENPIRVFVADYYLRNILL